VPPLGGGRSGRGVAAQLDLRPATGSGGFSRARERRQASQAAVEVEGEPGDVADRFRRRRRLENAAVRYIEPVR